MSDAIDRTVPVAFDITERAQVRVCPDHIGLSGFRELVKKTFRTTDRAISDHVHPDAVELCYAYQGAQHYSVGGCDYALQAGDVFVSYPNEVHSGGGRAQEKGGLLYYMIIDTVNELPSFLGLGPDEGPPLAAMVAALPRHFYAGYQLKPLFDELFRIYRARPPLASLLMRSQFCLLVEQLASAAAEAKHPRRSEIVRVLEAIEQRLPSVPQIRELAEILHLSESYFKQKFRQETGLPPAMYIMQRRIALAQSQLAEGRSVTETAYELGFSSSQHFATYFKAYTRQTPSAWRKARQKPGDGV